MKIRTRLSMESTLLTAGFMLLVFLVIYLSFSSYLQRDFYSRLKDRALITANVFLEKDELTRRSFIEIQKRYLQVLPEEQSFIYDQKNQQAFIRDTTGLIKQELITRVRDKDKLEFSVGNKQGVGINYEDNEGNFVIIIIANNVFGHSQLKNLLLVLAITYIAGLLIIFILGRRFARRALTPIVLINADIKKIRSNNLYQRITVPQNKDEINEVANNFNELLERLEHSFDLQRSFVNNASHELRTPLTSIIGELEVMLSRPREREEYEDTMRSVLAEAEKLTKILNQLFELSSYEGNEARLQMTDIGVGEFMAALQESWSTQNVRFEISHEVNPMHTAEKYKLTANAVLLETAINNIIKNALKFSENKEVFVWNEWHANSIRISVMDEGPGINPPDLENIFQPFFRSESARAFAGTGIGLSISQRIINIHKGSITVFSEPGEKTCFHIYLPIKTAF